MALSYRMARMLNFLKVVGYTQNSGIDSLVAFLVSNMQQSKFKSWNLKLILNFLLS